MIDVNYVFDGDIFVKEGTVTETLIYYDGPLLFTVARDNKEYLVSWATIDDNQNYWLVCPYNTNTKYEFGQSLLPLFEEALKNNDVGFIGVDNDYKITVLPFKGELKDFVG